MNKLKNITILLLIVFIIQKSNCAEQDSLHSIHLSDGSTLKIKKLSTPVIPSFRTSPFPCSCLCRYKNDEIDNNFKQSNIPLLSNPKNFKIILLASGNIMVHDKQAGEMVIFDKDGGLLKNVEQIKKMIEEKKYDISGLDKRELLKALFYAAEFDALNAIQIGYVLTEEDINNLLSQQKIYSFEGRILNIDILEDYCDISNYNKENGIDRAQTIIRLLKQNNGFYYNDLCKNVDNELNDVIISSQLNWSI